MSPRAGSTSFIADMKIGLLPSGIRDQEEGGSASDDFCNINGSNYSPLRLSG